MVQHDVRVSRADLRVAELESLDPAALGVPVAVDAPLEPVAQLAQVVDEFPDPGECGVGVGVVAHHPGPVVARADADVPAGLFLCVRDQGAGDVELVHSGARHVLGEDAVVQVRVERAGLELHHDPALLVGDRGAGPQDPAPPDVPVTLQPDRGAAGLERGPSPGRQRAARQRNVGGERSGLAYVVVELGLRERQYVQQAVGAQVAEECPVDGRGDGRGHRLPHTSGSTRMKRLSNQPLLLAADEQ